jgi:hypothetical protein
VILLLCVLIPCGTYFPKGAEPANSQERRVQWCGPRGKVFGRGPGASKGGGVQNSEGGASFHCRAAGRERSEVPRLSARVRT